MLKQPWHFTSCTDLNPNLIQTNLLISENENFKKYNIITMKKELGDCTRRLSLCFLFSSSAGGLSKSMSF